MNKLRLVALFMTIVLLSSCATKALWDSTSADRYARVRADLVTEEDVKKKELPYFKSSDGKSFYVKKTSGDRVWDYTLRLFGTPVAVVVDVVTVVLYIGTLGLASGIAPYVGDLGAEGDSKNARGSESVAEDKLASQATSSIQQ